MKIMENKLKNEYDWLHKVMKEVKERLSNAPKGQLRITKKRKGVEYYYKDDALSEKNKSNNGRYIRKEQYNLAVQLAQRDYDKSILKKGEERAKCIKEFLEKYQKTNLKEIYIKTNAFSDNDLEIITEKGERVRSKSEKIIADKLFSLGIPYRYEYPLTLSGGVRM